MAVLTCENCGHSIAADDVFCMNCGQKVVRPAAIPMPAVTPIPGMSGAVAPAMPSSTAPLGAHTPQRNPGGMPTDGFCPECGKKTRAGWLFCMECGTRLRPVSVNNVTTVAVAPLSDYSSGMSIDTGMEWDRTDAGVPADDYPTTVYDEEEADDAPTMVYGHETPLPTCTIIRASDGERYSVAYPATLGRGSAATVRISGNQYIGRVHASIHERDGRLYVTDEGSANHTYLNGEMLSPHEEMLLSDGDVISLAKDEFTVSIA